MPAQHAFRDEFDTQGRIWLRNAISDSDLALFDAATASSTKAGQRLDDTDDANGAMQIAAGSHAEGLVPSPKAEDVAQTYPIETCTAQRGDVLVLKMLTLHASRPAQKPSGRRVLRIDFSATQLPPPLSWTTHMPAS